MIVVIPAYEPDEKLIGVVRDFQEKAESFPIVIVNDGSKASCMPIFETLSEMGSVTVLHHPQNCGKGAALKTAFSYIRDHFPSDEGILTVDADGQHLIADSLRVCEEWENRPDELVLGSRRFTGNVPLRSRLGNAITRGAFHLTTGKRVYDTQTGLRAFAASRADEMTGLHGDRYEYEIHQLLHCCADSTGVYEVPIETVYIDDNKSSHFHAFRDSFKIYRVIFEFLGPTFLRFMSTSFFSFLIDFVSYCIVFYGVVAIFAGWDVAKSMFSFTKDAPTSWGARLEAAHPIIFAGGGAVLRVISLVLARVISSVCNFLLNRRFVFHASKRVHNFVRYAITVVMVLALNALFIELFTRLGVPTWLCTIFAQLICYPVSFFMQRVFVFRKGKEPVEHV